MSKICARVVRSERPRKTVTYEGVTAVSEFAVNYLFVRDLAAAAGRAAFPDWQPVDEKGDEAQLLPPLRNGETAQLHDPKIEDKETRPPPRYNEGTLIEAMQNAWRFVDDEVLRERLKEAKGIGTPATRAEIIGGLKKQGFLIAQGKHIVPTEAGCRRSAFSNRPTRPWSPAGSVAPQSTATTTSSRKRKADVSAASLAPAQPNSVTGTPLRIPYGNKEAALKLGQGKPAGSAAFDELADDALGDMWHTASIAPIISCLPTTTSSSRHSSCAVTPDRPLSLGCAITLLACVNAFARALSHDQT